MLAKKYEPEKHNVIGWYMSEKLDGVRATWDGECFTTRNGNVLDTPWRIAGKLRKIVLPENCKMDGELYMGRGNFNQCSGTVRRHGDEWIGIEYHVFDLLSPYNTRFSTRFEELFELTEGQFPEILTCVKQLRIECVEQMWQIHKLITGKGGEGLMLKNPESAYQFKRSADLLKVKKFLDCEATVVNIEWGKGKYEQMIGSLVCHTADGKEFCCGSGLTDADRIENPLCFIGKKITVKFFELSKDGIPRFPIYQGIRHDI